MPLFRDRPDLLARFHRGDERALEEVYWAYVERVEVVARHGALILSPGNRVRGAGGDEVEDLVHETFARAFTDKARRAYDGARPYGPYLATIARNLLVDEARRRGRELVLGELPDELAVETPDEPDWADPPTVREVETYLAALSEELRAVHQERYVIGRSQEAAATALGLSRQQLRTREQRLREGLADHLEKFRSQGRAQPVGKLGAIK